MRRTRRDVAHHLRRLAEDARRGPCRPACCRSADRSTVRWPSAVAVPDHRERAALARADRAELVEPVGRDREHVALLRLVAPHLARRHAGFLVGRRAEIDPRAAARRRARARAARSTARRRRRRESTGSGSPRRAPSSGRSPPARGAGSRRCPAAPSRSRGRRRSPPRPARTRRRRPCRSACPGRRAGSAAAPGGIGALNACAARMLPRPPAIMIGLW